MLLDKVTVKEVKEMNDTDVLVLFNEYKHILEMETMRKHLLDYLEAKEAEEK